METLIVESCHGYCVDIYADVWRLNDDVSLPMSHRESYTRTWSTHGFDCEIVEQEVELKYWLRCRNFEYYLSQLIHSTTATGIERLFRVLSPLVGKPGRLLDVDSRYAKLVLKLHAVILGGVRGRLLLRDYGRTRFAELFEDPDFDIGINDGYCELGEEQVTDVMRTLAAVDECRIDPTAAVAALLVVERGYTCADLASLRIKDGRLSSRWKPADGWIAYESYPPTMQDERHFVDDLVDRNRVFSHYSYRHGVSPDSPLFQSARSANGSSLPVAWFEDALESLSAEIRSAGLVGDETLLGWSGFHRMHWDRHREAWLSNRVGRQARAVA